MTRLKSSSWSSGTKLTSDIPSASARVKPNILVALGLQLVMCPRSSQPMIASPLASTTAMRRCTSLSRWRSQ